MYDWLGISAYMCLIKDWSVGINWREVELGFSVKISENQQGVLICISNGIRVYDFEYEYYVLIWVYHYSGPFGD